MKKAFSFFYLASAVSFIACAAVGIIWFPHAPYREANGAVIDKMGHPHSEAELRRFQWWEGTLMATGTGFAVSSVVSAIIRRHRALKT